MTFCYLSNQPTKGIKHARSKKHSTLAATITPHQHNLIFTFIQLKSKVDQIIKTKAPKLTKAYELATKPA